MELVLQVGDLPPQDLIFVRQELHDGYDRHDERPDRLHPAVICCGPRSARSKAKPSNSIRFISAVAGSDNEGTDDTISNPFLTPNSLTLAIPFASAEHVQSFVSVGRDVPHPPPIPFPIQMWDCPARATRLRPQSLVVRPSVRGGTT